MISFIVQFAAANMLEVKTEEMIPVKKILEVHHKLKSVVKLTPLHEMERLSKKYECTVLLKREDLQLGRSYKIRGAYNMMSTLTQAQREKGIVCASAGNHAQGVALSCSILKIRGSIFMPKTTPMQKVNKVKQFGGEFTEVILVGDTFDDANAEAVKYQEEKQITFIPPFDNELIIQGQGTVGKEIYEAVEAELDFIFVPIGGGGVSAGIGSYFKQVSPNTKIIGVEPSGAAGMKASIKAGKVVTLKEIDKFVDGAAVKTVGKLTFEICREVLDDIVVVPEGKTCSQILEMYNEEAIVVEPSGALSIAALDFYKDEIKGKKVVCLVSGGNNDITRMEEIKERSMLYEGLKHYFIINFPRRAGSFKDFVNQILGPTDEISVIEYSSKKAGGDTAPALIGIEVKDKKDLKPILKRLDAQGFKYELLNENPMLLGYLVK